MQHFIHYTKHADASHISLCTFILAIGSGYAFTPSTPYLSPCEINMKIYTGSECSRGEGEGGTYARRSAHKSMHSSAFATHRSSPSKNEGESTLMDCIDTRTSACTNSDALLRP